MADVETKRLKLTVTTEPEEKPVGKNNVPKLSFKAKDGEKEAAYFTFTQNLFPSIKNGAEIECDVAISEREYDGNTYIDRKVTQIYQDGQPVAQRKPWDGGGRSDASIESQVAVKEVGLALCNGKVTIPEGITDAYWTWIKARLSPITESPAQEAAQPTSTEPGKESLRKELNDLFKQTGWTASAVQKWLMQNFTQDNTKAMTPQQLKDAVNMVRFHLSETPEETDPDDAPF